MRAVVALAPLTCAAVLAACGGGGGARHAGAVGPYGPRSSPAAVSRCMRANGVSGFPDPSVGPSGGVGFNGLVETSAGSIVVDGKTFAGPAVTAAEKACKEYLPGGAGPPPALSESQRRQLLADAQCMRRHGIPLPDPNFGNPSGPPKQAPLVAGLNPASPAFQHAAEACGLGRGGNIAVPG